MVSELNRRKNGTSPNLMSLLSSERSLHSTGVTISRTRRVRGRVGSIFFGRTLLPNEPDRRLVDGSGR